MAKKKSIHSSEDEEVNALGKTSIKNDERRMVTEREINHSIGLEREIEKPKRIKLGISKFKTGLWAFRKEKEVDGFLKIKVYDEGVIAHFP